VGVHNARAATTFDRRVTLARAFERSFVARRF